MGTVLLLPLVAAALLALAAASVRGPVRARSYAPVLASAVILGCGAALAVVAVGGAAVPTALDGLLRADALSAFLLAVVGAVGLTATWGGLPGRADPPTGRRFSALLCLFLGAMSLAVLADNLGILWVAVEATTITTAFLVGDGGTRRAVEAAWKYVVLGSVGVAIAFLGLVLLYAASLPTGSPTLSWSALVQAPPGMDPALVRVAVGLAILGFATKAGLAPMHSWLPDAHSQAPAPVSALMSGVLLSVAFYAILRVQAVGDAVIGPGLARGLLVAAALLSLLVSAALLVRQRDLKRMLAYSSLEHMGLLALAAAIGGTLALSAALLHVLCHGLAKSSAFVTAGRIARVEGSTALDDLQGLLVRRPGLAVPFLVGVVALLGFPPFGALLHRGRHRRRRDPPGPALADGARRGSAAGGRGRARPARPAPRARLGARSGRPPGARRADPAGPRAAGDGRRGLRRRLLRGAARRRLRHPDGGLVTTVERIEVSPDQWEPTLDRLLERGLRVALAAGHEDADALRVVHVLLGPGDTRVEVTLRTDPATPALPSLAHRDHTLGRFEREIRDMYGIEPTGHPLPRRLVRHAHWPAGYYPMRRRTAPVPSFAEDGTAFPFLPVEGAGVYEIPVGPVHAGMIEPGHFRFSVVGETIVRMKARLWFVHRGVERLAEGMTPADGLVLAERISGDTAVGHGWACAAALEDAAGLVVGEQDLLLRALLLELERLHCHVADLGALANDVGFGIANAHAWRIREDLLRLNAQVTGHRLLRGGVVVGGARVCALPDPARLRRVAAEVQELVEVTLGNGTVRDRFTGTAVLPRAQADALGTLGYVARASGRAVDARVDHPSVNLPAYAAVLEEGGDVLARYRVRAREVQVSAAVAEELVALLGSARGSSTAAAGPYDDGAGLGIVEGWRGTIVHRVELGSDGRIARLRVVDPSFLNWPALPVALADTIVPDFPLANKSFNQSYAGNDL